MGHFTSAGTETIRALPQMAKPADEPGAAHPAPQRSAAREQAKPAGDLGGTSPSHFGLVAP
jgi:hypothetical protein